MRRDGREVCQKFESRSDRPNVSFGSYLSPPPTFFSAHNFVNIGFLAISSASFLLFDPIELLLRWPQHRTVLMNPALRVASHSRLRRVRPRGVATIVPATQAVPVQQQHPTTTWRSLASASSAAAASPPPTAARNQQQQQQHSKKQNSASAAALLCSKLLTREMLKTRREWTPLRDDFQDIKRAVEDDWAVEYGPTTTKLRRPICDGSVLAEVSFQTDDLVQNLVPVDKDGKPRQPQSQQQQQQHQIKVDESKVDTENIIKAEFHPASPKPVDDDDDGEPNNNDKNGKKKKMVKQILGTEFKVRIARMDAPSDEKKQQPPAMVLECGMRNDGSSDIQVYHVHFEPSSGGDGTSDNDNRQLLSISHKFRHPEQSYDVMEQFLAEECGIDDQLGSFLMNYSVFRLRREKLQFLQGVKFLMDSTK